MRRITQLLARLAVPLLVIAWVCANGPQAAGFEIIRWVQGAGHFSHQQRLLASVEEARIALAGGHQVEVAVHVVESDRTPSVPEVPPEATLKKLELGEPEVCIGVIPVRDLESALLFASGLPVEHRGDVPHPPPRRQG